MSVAATCSRSPLRLSICLQPEDALLETGNSICHLQENHGRHCDSSVSKQRDIVNTGTQFVQHQDGRNSVHHESPNKCCAMSSSSSYGLSPRKRRRPTGSPILADVEVITLPCKWMRIEQDGSDTHFLTDLDVTRSTSLSREDKVYDFTDTEDQSCDSEKSYFNEITSLVTSTSSSRFQDQPWNSPKNLHDQPNDISTCRQFLGYRSDFCLMSPSLNVASSAAQNISEHLHDVELPSVESRRGSTTYDSNLSSNIPKSLSCDTSKDSPSCRRHILPKLETDMARHSSRHKQCRSRRQKDVRVANGAVRKALGMAQSSHKQYLNDDLLSSHSSSLSMSPLTSSSIMKNEKMERRSCSLLSLLEKRKRRREETFVKKCNRFPVLPNKSLKKLEAVSGFLLQLGLDGTILYVSKNVSDYLGYNQGQMIGFSIDQFIHPSDLKELKRHMDSVHSLENNGKIPMWLTHRTFHLGMRFGICHGNNLFPDYIMVQWKAKMGVIEYDKGYRRTYHLISVCRPVRTYSIWEIRQRGAMLMSCHDLGFRLTFCDSRITELMDYKPCVLIGRSAYHIHCSKDVRLGKSCRLELKDGRLLPGYFLFLSRTGNWVWFVSHTNVNDDPQNRPHVIGCRNCVVSEPEGEKALIKRKRECQKSKCLVFSLDTALPVSVRRQVDFNHSKKSKFEHLSSHSNNDNGATTGQLHVYKNIFSKGCDRRHRLRQSFTDSLVYYNSSCISVESFMQDSKIKNGANEDFILSSDNIQKGSCSLDKEPFSNNSSVMENDRFLKSGKIEQFGSNSISASSPTSEDFTPSTAGNCNTHLSHVFNSCVSEDHKSKSRDQNSHQTLVPIEIQINQLPYPGHMTLKNSNSSNSYSLSDDQEECENISSSESRKSNNIFSSEVDESQGFEFCDKTVGFSDEPLEFADPSLNQSKDESEAPVSLISDEAYFSENTSLDSEMDIDSQPNFFSNTFNLDIFPELDLNSEFSFQTNCDLAYDEHQEIIESGDNSVSKDTLITPGSSSMSFIFNSEPSKAPAMEGGEVQPCDISSFVMDPYKCASDIENTNLVQSFQPLPPPSTRVSQGSSASSPVSYNYLDSIATAVNSSEFLREQLNEEHMEVESGVIPQEISVTTKNVSFSPIPSSPSVQTVPQSPPAMVDIDSSNDTSPLNSITTKAKSRDRPSLLRSLLKTDNREVAGVSPLYEESQNFDYCNEDLNSAIFNNKGSSDSFNCLSPSDSIPLRSPVTPRTSTELPLPRSAVSSRQSSCQSPCLTDLLDEEQSSDEGDSCTSYMSGDHLPEDLVDLAMEYCASLDSHRAQELISELSDLEWEERLKNRCVMSRRSENIKPSSRPLPIPGLLSKTDHDNHSVLSDQQQKHPLQDEHEKINNIISQMIRRSETSPVSCGKKSKMSLLREAVTSPNVDKLIEKLPLGRASLQANYSRYGGQDRSSLKPSSHQLSMSNVHSKHVPLNRSNKFSTLSSSTLHYKPNHNLESVLAIHSTSRGSKKSSLGHSVPSISVAIPVSQKLSKAVPSSPSSSLVQISLSPPKGKRRGQSYENANAAASTKNSSLSRSKSFTSTSEPVSVMVMRKEHHRSRRSKNVATQTDARPNEIYPEPEISPSDVIITPSVYVTQQPSPVSKSTSSSASGSPLQSDCSILSILVKSSSHTSSLEPGHHSASSGVSSSPASSSDSESQPGSPSTTLELPSCLASHRKQTKPVSSLPFLQGLLTGELSKDRYQLLDQEILERGRSGSRSSCSDLE